MQVQDVLMLPALRLLAVAIGSALVANCLTLLFRPALIGRGGERAVRLALARLGLPALHDVVLADALGHTQIDHLVRTTQGIVVIETKTFSGWITGTLYSAEWTQRLAGGHVRHRFQNPVRQNHRHEVLETVPIPVPALGRLVVDSPWMARVNTGELNAAWTRLGTLARRTPRLRRLHRAEVRARRKPELVLTERMAWALLPVGAVAMAAGLAPMLIRG